MEKSVLRLRLATLRTNGGNVQSLLKEHLNNRDIQDGLPHPHPDASIPVRLERSEAKSKDALMPPVPIVQRFLKNEPKREGGSTPCRSRHRK